MPSRDRAPMPRRALLAGLAASPAAITLAIAPAPAMAHPAATAARAAVLAKVVELTQLYDAAMKRSATALEAMDVADGRLIKPPIPGVLFQQPDDPLDGYVTADRRHDGRLWYGSAMKVDQLRRWPMVEMGWEVEHARRVEIVAAYDRWQADVVAAEDAAGVTAAKAEYKAAIHDEEKPIRQRILELRSSEPAALRLKVRAYLDVLGALNWQGMLDDDVARGVEQENGPWESAMAASILRDVVTAYRQADA